MRGAQKHYPLMKTWKIIETILSSPCWKPADDCILFLWTTNNFLPDALEVMKAIGFTYKTNGVWAKDRFGLGYYLRGAHELLLLGVRGSNKPLVRNRSTLIGGKLLPRRKHSQKPDEAYDLIEAVSPGPRLEMFARAAREGWDQHGNEVIE